jgi:8-oxo-dGTP diphosphatase
MENFRLAVKSLIINDRGELLLIKRRDNDVHCPSHWEIPGGRLNPGEDPEQGLKRETKEETGLDIEIKHPIRVHHFIREDNQKITMITFFCKPISNSIKLSEEHTEHEWCNLETAKEKIHNAFIKDINIFKENFLR